MKQQNYNSKRYKQMIIKEQHIVYQHKHLVIELNNYLVFYIIKPKIKMKEFFKSIRKQILSGRQITHPQFNAILPYLVQEPDMIILGGNNPNRIIQKVFERYTPLIKNLQHDRATLDHFLSDETCDEDAADPYEGNPETQWDKASFDFLTDVIIEETYLN